MSHSTCNSRDAMLPSSSTSLASSAGSSMSTAAPSTMSFPPALVQQLVDAVKASLPVQNAVVQLPEPSSSGELKPVTAPSVQAIGGVPSDQFAFCDASGFWWPSFVDSFYPIRCSTYRYALVCSSFVCEHFFCPTTIVGPSLSSSPLSANSTFIVPLDRLSTNTFLNPLPVLHQLFVVGPGFSPVPAKVFSQIVSG